MKKFSSTKVIPLGSTAFRQHGSNSHCKFCHGYFLKTKIWFSCNELDNKGWCVDFGSLKQLKEILELQFDHTTCIAADDPELETFKELDKKKIIDLRIFQDGVGIERFAEFVLTAANVYIKAKTNDRCWVEKVEVWEHEGNSAIVEAFDEESGTNKYVNALNKTSLTCKNNLSSLTVTFDPTFDKIKLPDPLVPENATEIIAKQTLIDFLKGSVCKPHLPDNVVHEIIEKIQEDIQWSAKLTQEVNEKNVKEKCPDCGNPERGSSEIKTFIGEYIKPESPKDVSVEEVSQDVLNDIVKTTATPKLESQSACIAVPQSKSPTAGYKGIFEGTRWGSSTKK